MKKLLLISFLASLFAQDGKFSGVIFYNYTYDLSEEQDGYNSFDLSRVYLTYQQNLSESVSYKFQTDIDPKASPKSVYLKNAKVDWKLPAGKLTLGLQGMNIFNVTEKTWGYRYLEKSPMDRHKFSSSADMGAAFSGKLHNIQYSLMLTNGSGYKNPENDKYKKFSTQFVYGEKKLSSAKGYNFGFSFSTEPAENESATTQTTTVTGFFGGLSQEKFRFGAEFDLKSVSETEGAEQILAFYGTYNISAKLSALVYVDLHDADNSTDNNTETYTIAGLEYKPVKGIIITPNIRMTTPENGEGTSVAMVNFQFKF